ncbi:hypothetical protein LBMAG46_18360 [Planctomycetia bacterium]|nr:hypothetical protein LBMAG46_18360 [Planctomycetia bacterium]
MNFCTALTVILLALQEAQSNAAGATSQPAPAVTATSAAAAQTWSLKYQFHQGQQLRYQSRQQMTLEAQVGENHRVDVSQVRQVRRYSVSDTNGDLTKLSMQFEDVWMQRQVDQEPAVEFRSSMKAGEVPEVFKNVAHSLRGAAPVFRVTGSGRSVAAASDMAKDSKTLPSPVAPVADSADSNATTATVTTRDAASDPGSFLMLLPDVPVCIGGTWKEEFQVQVRGGENLQLPVQILRTYRLENVENGIARITFRSSVRTPLRGTVIRSQLIQATPSGSFLLDISRGLMMQREFRWNETVIGALGPESILSSHGTQTDELLQLAAEPAAN